ncbi:MAG: flagellar motor protein MotB [Bacteroides sp.]|nr:flagellar motor protein MotB [Prevotella sp.]MCM1407339.1 flagellar motor protein MotB [Treponema brennaborense]MCM1469829.1 flagellar motor protein MotB [Bacteroides sp.]
MAKKEKKEPEKPSAAWQGTYGDMITLMLCFFVMLYNPNESDPMQMAALSASIQGDPTGGGMSLAAGRLADLGNTINTLPALEKGRSLGLAVKRAVSLYAPAIKSNKITLTSDERGVVITLASDSFFKPGSAELNIEDTRKELLSLAQFFTSDDIQKDDSGKPRRFRIEGHTDSSPVSNPEKWASNWELSAARAVNVLHYLTDFGVDEKRFSVAGYADTRPKFSNDTAEGRAYNRRVDIIILDEAHF